MSKDISQNSKAKRSKSARARSVSEVLGNVLEPVLARRAGMTLDIIGAWPGLAGQEFAKVTLPLKIKWPRRAHEDDPFEPATLLIACESSAALFFQHEQTAILERVNLFFGFEAIGRLQITQRPVPIPAKSKGKAIPSISDMEEVRLQEMLAEIDDPELRETLAKLGRGVISGSQN